MILRPKTVQRLLILMAVTVAIVVTLSGAYLFKQHRRQLALEQTRDQGTAAFLAGDFATALAKLKDYVSTNPDDTAAMFNFAVARYNVELPRRQHVSEARQYLQQVLRVDPDHVGAKYKLLEIYDQFSMTAELIRTAASLLENNPQDAIALRYRAVALRRLADWKPAIDAWKQYVKVRPTDIRAYIEVLTAMQGDKVPGEELVATSTQWATAHHGDSRFLLPVAYAHSLAGQPELARQKLDQAASSDLSDFEFLVELVSLFDRLEQFDRARSVIEKASAKSADPRVLQLLVDRSWQAGRQKEIVDRVSSLQSPEKLPTNLLAVYAVSLFDLEQREKATAILTILKSRNTDSVASAWSNAIEACYGNAILTSLQRIDRYRDCLAADPYNAIARIWIARELSKLGELDRAVRRWSEAAMLMPGAALPYLEMSQALLAGNRAGAALRAAGEAYERMPSSSAVCIQLAVARWRYLPQNTEPGERDALLEFVRQLHVAQPADSRLLVLHATLIAEAGRPVVASKLIRDRLSTAGLDPTSILTLSKLSRSLSLDVLPDLLTAAENFPDSPDVSLSRAIDLHQTGRANEARNLIDTKAGSNPGSGQWQLARARFHHAIDSSEASSVWQQLARSYPDDLQTQLTVLDEAKSILTIDRAFSRRVIDNVKRLTGEDAVRWRVEQTRWLLASGEPADAREAASLSMDLAREEPTRTDVRLLLARSLLATDPSASTAVEHLRVAFQQAPTDLAVGLELAQLLRDTNHSSDANLVLKRLRQNLPASPADRVKLASALADASMYDDAIELLIDIERTRPLDERSRLLMAELLLVKQNIAQAKVEFSRLLAAPGAAPATLAAGAAFERQHGSASRSADLLSRLAAIDTVDALVARARFHSRFAELSNARKAYRKAIDMRPGDLSLWQEAISMETGASDFVSASSLASAALVQFPRDVTLLRAQGVADALSRPEASGQKLSSLIESLQSDIDRRDQVEALRALQESSVQGKPTARLADALVVLAERYTSAVALQREAVATCLAVGRNERAISLARRSFANNPSNPQAAELAAQTLLYAGQLTESRTAAARWRDLSPESMLKVDLFVAQIDRAEGKWPEVLSRLAPYANDNTNAQVMSLMARASVATGTSSRAFDRLRPLFATSSAARAAGCDAAMLVTDPAEALKYLEEIAKQIPKDNDNDQFLVASAMISLCNRSADDQPARKALTLAALRSSDKTSIRWLMLSAEAARLSGDFTFAENTLRSLQKSTPESAPVANALAYVLLQQNKNLDEAFDLARRATDLDASAAYSRDTLARVAIARNDYNTAQIAFKDAIARDSQHVDALVGLAGLLNREGKKSEAQILLARADRVLSTGFAGQSRLVPIHLRTELTELRQSISNAKD